MVSMCRTAHKGVVLSFLALGVEIVCFHAVSQGVGHEHGGNDRVVDGLRALEGVARGRAGLDGINHDKRLIEGKDVADGEERSVFS